MRYYRFLGGILVVALALSASTPTTAQQTAPTQIFLPFVQGAPATLDAASGTPSVSYVIFDLGTLGGTYSFPVAINNHRQIIGTAGEVDYETHGFLWQEGRMQSLGSLGGGNTRPADINDQGQIVGASSTADGRDHAFLWQNGEMIDLGTLGNHPMSRAIAINEQGQVIGRSWDPDVNALPSGFLWQQGNMTSLGVLNPLAINEQAQILGTTIGHGDSLQAHLWENGAMQYLGTLGGASTEPRDLNDLGQVVGASDTADGNQHAFLWENGVMHDLGTLGGTASRAFQINNRSQIIGWSRLAANDVGFFCWENGMMRALDPHHFRYSILMNDEGQIVGVGADGSHLFLLSNGVVTDLGEAPVDNPLSSSVHPVAINDHGQVLLYGSSDGITRAYLATNVPPFPERLLLLSSSTGGKVHGIAFADEDILAQNLETHAWTMYFDGSDVGITDDVDAFGVLPDGSLLLSLGNRVQVPDLGTVDDSDIIRFQPLTLGSRTSGNFRWYFDASDVGLGSAEEDIDAIHVTPDGLLILSTLGNMEVKGAAGKDEDLFAFHSTRLGALTAGTWSPYFDGSDMSLTNNSEDLWGLWRDAQTHDLYLTTAGAFDVNGLTGSGADIFRFQPTTLGTQTTGTFHPFWRGAAYGFGGEKIDDLEIITRLPLPNEVASAKSEPVAPEVGDDLGDDVLDDGSEAEIEESTYQIFLPFLQR